MVKIFSIEDRKSTLDYILSTAKDCPKIVSLVQVGSGAEGFRLSFYYHPVIFQTMLLGL